MCLMWGFVGGFFVVVVFLCVFLGFDTLEAFVYYDPF